MGLDSFSVSADLLSGALVDPAERLRHRAKVEDAILRHLADMVTDEKILVTNGRRALSVPIPELKEFRIRFDPGGEERVGQAGQDGAVGSTRDQGSGGEAQKEGGDQPGLDVEEADVSLEEIHDAVFAHLELPRLSHHAPPRRQCRNEPGPIRREFHGVCLRRGRLWQRFSDRCETSPVEAGSQRQSYRCVVLGRSDGTEVVSFGRGRHADALRK